MVAPVIVAAAVIAAASAYQSWRNSEAARKASAEEIKRLDEIYSKIQQPDFTDPSAPPLNLEEYALLQKFVPEVQRYVDEANPTIPKYVQEMKTEYPDYVKQVAPTLIEGKSEEATQGLEAQKAALKRYGQLSQTGTDEYSKALMNDAMMRSNLEARAQQGAIQEQFKRQGNFGSGLQFAAQMGAQQSNQLSASQAQNAAAMEAYRNKLSALGASATLGGQMRASALGMEQANANTMNQYNQNLSASQNAFNQNKADFISAFNARTARNQQDWENNQAGIMNAYAQRNADYARRLEDARVNGANQAQLYNLQNEAKIAMANTDIRNQEATYDANMGWQVQQEKNKLAQQKYADEMTKAAAQAGVSQLTINNQLGAAQDKNAMYTGIANAAATGAAGYQAQSNWDQTHSTPTNTSDNTSANVQYNPDGTVKKNSDIMS